MSTTLRRYTRGATQVSLTTGTGAKHYYHFDHQGTTQCLTDSAGAVTDRFASDAWGTLIRRSGTTPNPFWYIGNAGYQKERVDQSTYYIRARYYRARLGRWLTIDPILRANAGYIAMVNSPALLVDPTGWEPCEGTKDCCCCVGGTTLAAPHSVGWTDFNVSSDERKVVLCIEREIRRKIVNGKLLVGFRFDINAKLLHEKSNKSGSCNLEWFECESRVPKSKDVSGTWEDLSIKAKTQSTGIKQSWEAYQKSYRERSTCPGTVSLPLWDAPLSFTHDYKQPNPAAPCGRNITPRTQTRDVRIYARLVSADCDPKCDNPEWSVGIRIRLHVQAGRVLETPPPVISNMPTRPTIGAPCE